MSYTISEVAKMMGITPSTLRYYDKEGLLPNIKRVNGIRIFEDEDFSWLRVLNCMKNTGMPIRKIKRYVDLSKQGDSTLEERYELIKEQRQNVQDQMNQLKYYMEELDYKDWYYRTAIEKGSEEAVLKMIQDNPSKGLENDKIPGNDEK